MSKTECWPQELTGCSVSEEVSQVARVHRVRGLRPPGLAFLPCGPGPVVPKQAFV